MQMSIGRIVTQTLYEVALTQAPTERIEAAI